MEIANKQNIPDNDLLSEWGFVRISYEKLKNLKSHYPRKIVEAVHNRLSLDKDTWPLSSVQFELNVFGEATKDLIDAPGMYSFNGHQTWVDLIYVDRVRMFCEFLKPDFLAHRDCDTFDWIANELMEPFYIDIEGCEDLSWSIREVCRMSEAREFQFRRLMQLKPSAHSQ